MMIKGLHIELCNVLEDNCAVILRDDANDKTAAVDTPDADAINDILSAKGWNLTHILNTHHHHDHTAGNKALKQATGCTIIGPSGGRIPCIDIEVEDNEQIFFSNFAARVICTPGHTLDHICYWFESEKVLFAGDALFPLGCGRLFEGDMNEIWLSLCKIRSLPPDTLIYCGHDNALSNALFALMIDPDNQYLQARSSSIRKLHQAGHSAIPFRLDMELATNPFLRAEEPAIQDALGMAGADPSLVFAEMRKRKSAFRP